MIIPVHHTEEIPMINCGEGNIFTKTLDGGGWTCMTKEEYEIKQETIHHNTMSALGWIIAVVVFCAVLILYLFTKDS